MEQPVRRQRGAGRGIGVGRGAGCGRQQQDERRDDGEVPAQHGRHPPRPDRDAGGGGPRDGEQRHDQRWRDQRGRRPVGRDRPEKGIAEEQRGEERRAGRQREDAAPPAGGARCLETGGQRLAAADGDPADIAARAVGPGPAPSQPDGADQKDGRERIQPRQHHQEEAAQHRGGRDRQPAIARQDRDMLGRAAGHVDRQRLTPAVTRLGQQPLAACQRDAQIGIVGQRVARGDGRQAGEVVGGRRDRHRPFQRRRAPGIAAMHPPQPDLQHHVDQEQREAERLQEAADRRQQVEPGPPHAFGIGVDPPRHAEQSGQVHHEEGQVEADEDQPERRLAYPHHPLAPGDVRQPVIGGGQHREDEPADQHIMEMRGDEGGVVRLRIERHHRQHHAGQPAQHEDDEEADQIEHRQLHLGPPLPQRTQPGEDLHRRWDRNQRRGGGKESQRHVRDAGGEHVVHPQPEAEKGQRHDRRDDRTITQQAGARHDGQDGRHRARRRQEDDVDFRMAEQPEQMLPQQRRSAEFGRIEGPAKGALDLQQDRPQDQRRKAEHHHARRPQQIPGEDRHPVEPHAGRAQLQDRHGDLDRRAHRRDLDEGDAEQPDVGIDARRIGLARQGRIQEPARIGGDTGQHRQHDDRAAEQIAPPAERGEARKGQVATAQHLGQQIHGQPLEHRDGEQEHHDAAMHREQLVIDLRPDERAARRGELRADQHGQHAADCEEDEGRDDEPLADVAMVDRAQIAAPARLVAPDRRQILMPLQRAHRAPSVNAVHPAASCATTVKL